MKKLNKLNGTTQFTSETYNSISTILNIACSNTNFLIAGVASALSVGFLWPGVVVAGASYDSVGVAGCVHPVAGKGCCQLVI